MHFTDWADIYSGWDDNDELKYYWEQWELHIYQLER